MFLEVCATLATLPAHGLAVTVRVRGVFVSNERNSSEITHGKFWSAVRS
jgi:hypothetical protein